MSARLVAPVGRGASPAGFSLVELLLAAVICTTVSAAAFGWVWTLASVARRADDRAQASTIAAAAERTVAEDAATSTGVAPPQGRERDVTLLLTRDCGNESAAAAAETLLAWDPAREVMWRNAPETYVADNVSGFAVSYRLSDGKLVGGTAMSGTSWSEVRAVRVRLTVCVGGAIVTRQFEAIVGSGP